MNTMNKGEDDDDRRNSNKEERRRVWIPAGRGRRLAAAMVAHAFYAWMAEVVSGVIQTAAVVILTSSNSDGSNTT